MRLETDRIKLISYGSKHILFFEQWRRYYGNHFFTSLYPSMDALSKGFESYLEGAMQGNRAWYVIIPKDDAFMPIKGEFAKHREDPVGMVGLNDIDPKNGRTELGQMFIIDNARGRGYMEDAIGLMSDLAFDELRMNVIYLWTWQGNVAAIKLYEKCGFKYNGAIPNGFFRNGRPYDLLLMTLTKAEWVVAKSAYLRRQEEKKNTEDTAKAA